MQKKIETIETLRGLAAILVVIGHVIGGSHDSGMSVSEDSFYRFAYFSLQYLRIPLFTTISGYVYALHPLEKGALEKFISGKSRRILIPLISVATMQFLACSFIPGVNHPTHIDKIWKIYFYPYAQFWFLQAVFLSFLAIGCLENWKPLTTFYGWFLFWIATIACFLIAPKISLFSFNNFLFLLPFFTLGIGLKRFDKIIFKKIIITILFVIFLMTFTIQQAAWFTNMGVDQFLTWRLNLIEGFSGLICLFYLRINNKRLAYIGSFAYTIFLFHIFFTSGSRILFASLGISNEHLIFLISTPIGIFLPILTDKILTKNPYTKFLFLGRSSPLVRNEPITPRSHSEKGKCATAP